jgi:NAD(P)-dependent dehydrogenase (short-subunit alcohol dehydrogenase family)
MNRLFGKSTLITGRTSGSGLATARAFLASHRRRDEQPVTSPA